MAEETGLYTIQEQNWYKSFPYGFRFYGIDNKIVTIWLPISPNNLTINTNFATNIITTLYGIVEEHSEVRYYDISIQGTTGIAPKYSATVSRFPAEDGEQKGSVGRINSEVNSGSGKKGEGLWGSGVGAEAVNIAEQTANLARDVFLSASPKKPAILPIDTGYARFHRLYQFFLKYKKDASLQNTKDSKKTRNRHPLEFLNYKDGNKYNCIPISFTMVRSVDNPMLYNYNIKLRAFNLAGVDEEKLNIADQKVLLGLDGLEGQSLFAKFVSTAQDAAQAISALLK
jgi:hypothetical protein